MIIKSISSRLGFWLVLSVLLLLSSFVVSPAAEAFEEAHPLPSFPCQEAEFLITSLKMVNTNSQGSAISAGDPITIYVYLDSIGREEDYDVLHKPWPTRDNVTIVLQIVDSEDVAVAIATKEIALANNNSSSPQIVSSILLTNRLSKPGKYDMGIFLASTISDQAIPELLAPIKQTTISATDEPNPNQVNKAPNMGTSRNNSGSEIPAEQFESLMLYDDFGGEPYVLDDGEYSPNCKWQSIHNGYGSLGVRPDEKSESDGIEPINNVFFEVPAPASGPSIVNPDGKSTSGTHAGLALTTVHNYKNFHISLDMKTKMQLRHGQYPPNPWETAWIAFNYVDDWHHYYFTLKNNGYELGKKDNDMQLEQQIYLVSSSYPRASIGSWQHVDLVVDDNHFLVYVNGSRLLDYVDKDMSKDTFSSGGAIGLYSEDAEVIFDNVYIVRLQSR